MRASNIALAALLALAGSALATSPPPGGGPRPGGPPPGGPPPGGPPPGGPPGGKPPGGPPPSARPPAPGHYPGGGYWYGPRVGFYFGSPGWWGWGGPGYYWPGYYGTYGYPVPSYVYGPPGVVLTTGEVVYVEKEQGSVSTAQPAPDAIPAPAATPPAASPTGWWYLCASPRGAYPYVRECPGGWERVPAVPPGRVK
jgi:hypothetical protein